MECSDSETFGKSIPLFFQLIDRRSNWDRSLYWLLKPMPEKVRTLQRRIKTFKILGLDSVFAFDQKISVLEV